MSERNRLEEVLEECVSAYVEGRRSIAESLSLYPSLASQLKPLLTTAAELSDNFSAYNPPIYARDRGLATFLASARDRARLKAISRSFPRHSILAAIWQGRQLPALAAVAAVVVVTVAMASGVLTGNGGGEGGDFVAPIQTQGAPSTAATTPTVGSHAQQVAGIADRLRHGERISSEELATLNEATKQLVADISDLNSLSPEDKATLEHSLQERDAIVEAIIAQDPSKAADPVVQETIDLTRTVAGAFGPSPVPPTPTAVVAPTDTPAPTAPATDAPTAVPTAAPTAPPTAVATPAPTAEPTAPPTAEPTAPPTPEPTPVETPVIREPQ